MMDFTPAGSQQAVAALAAEVLASRYPTRGRHWPAPACSTPPPSACSTSPSCSPRSAGRAPSPQALATLMTGALPLLRWGCRPDLLAAVASGELLLTAALREPSHPQPDPPATAFTHGTITGTKVGVLHAEQASLMLVPRSPSSMIVGSSGQIATNTAHDHGVALVDPRARGVTLTRTPSASGEPEYTLRHGRGAGRGMLGGAECVRDLYQLAVAGACALADGAVAGALALTRDHVATREQFGRPLAAFQAVSQQVADVYIASRTMHLATLSACWRLARARDGPGNGPAAAADLDVAGYWCAEQAPRSVRICHHLHGGLGMDVTYPLHRFSSLVANLVRFLGGADYRLERLACSST